MRGGLYIGASGWRYDCWRLDFYAGVRRKDWLRHYAGRFNAVEVNASFYGSLAPKTFERWRDETPPDFRFAIKAHRYLTHVARLRFPAESLARQRGAAMTLGEKLAVVVWQMPKRFPLDMARLASFAATLRDWPEARHALEFRDASWFIPEVADCLAQHGLAACQSDSADWPLWDAVTTDLAYVRLHGHAMTYASAYTDAQLRFWAARIENWLAENRQVHVYFDNTDAGNAPRDALRLMALLGG